MLEQPRTAKSRRQEFTPFEAIDKLMAGKLSRDDWQARCHELGISDLLLPRDVKTSAPIAVPLQPELFSVEGSPDLTAKRIQRLG